MFLPKFSNWRVRMHSTHQFIYISHLNLSNNNLYLSTLHGIKKVRYCPISIMRSRCVIKYSSKIVFGRMKKYWKEWRTVVGVALILHTQKCWLLVFYNLWPRFISTKLYCSQGTMIWLQKQEKSKNDDQSFGI